MVRPLVRLFPFLLKQELIKLSEMDTVSYNNSVDCLNFDIVQYWLQLLAMQFRVQ